jgi:hypothetical protein
MKSYNRASVILHVTVVVRCILQAPVRNWSSCYLRQECQKLSKIRKDVPSPFVPAGYRPDSIAIAGGATRSALWLQLHADICNVPFILTKQTEAPMLGCAILVSRACLRSGGRWCQGCPNPVLGTHGTGCHLCYYLSACEVLIRSVMPCNAPCCQTIVRGFAHQYLPQ